MKRHYTRRKISRQESEKRRCDDKKLINRQRGKINHARLERRFTRPRKLPSPNEVRVHGFFHSKATLQKVEFRKKRKKSSTRGRSCDRSCKIIELSFVSLRLKTSEACEKSKFSREKLNFEKSRNSSDLENLNFSEEPLSGK